MKKLVALLIVLLAVETYGVYGRHQADRIMYTCEMEVGPLCFSWKENALGKLLSGDQAAALEEKLDKARKAFEEDFVDKLAQGAKKKNGIEAALDQVRSKLREAGEAMKDAFEE